MFSTLNTLNNTEIMIHAECVSLNIFGLIIKLLMNDIIAVGLGIMSCLIFAEMLADYMIKNIEEAKREKDKEREKDKDLKLKEDFDALSKELIKLQEEVQELRKKNEPKIIQCDKCYHEYCETEIKTCHIIGPIFQQYCTDCLNKGYKIEYIIQ